MDQDAELGARANVGRSGWRLSTDPRRRSVNHWRCAGCQTPPKRPKYYLLFKRDFTRSVATCRTFLMSASRVVGRLLKISEPVVKVPTARRIFHGETDFLQCPPAMVVCPQHLDACFLQGVEQAPLACRFVATDT